MLQVQLQPGLKGSKWAYLRPLRGHDEAFVKGIGTLEATQFLDRLLVKVPGTNIGSGTAKELAVCDCDRLFAALYLEYFGNQIESTVVCQSCDQLFELSFSLPELMVSLDNIATSSGIDFDERGIYTLPNGTQFRLPTAGDRDSLIGLEPEQAMTRLLKCCVVAGDPSLEHESLESAMEKVGPVLDLDLDSSCPHCGFSQTVKFDIQSYVLQVLAFERRFLNREVHRLAMSYGWGYQEILDLPREDRRSFFKLIEADLGALRRRRL